MRSYVDNTLLSAPLTHAKGLIASWEDKLASAHLRLKRAKLQVYRTEFLKQSIRSPMLVPVLRFSSLFLIFLPFLRSLHLS